MADKVNMGLAIEYIVIRSERKTIAIQILPHGNVVVRAPKRMRMEEVSRFVESKTGWLEKHLLNRTPQNQEIFSEEKLKALRDKARVLVRERVQHFAPLVGVTYNQITIRTQHTRWGSCSNKDNLNFNCLLALVPMDVLDYVVVHELCHREEKNHSDRFWKRIRMPDPPSGQ